MLYERVNAADAEAAQRRMAGALAARGLQAGDRVAIKSASSGNMLALIMGALRTGIVPVLLNAGLLPSESAALIADARASLVVGDTDLEELASGPPVELCPVPLARPMHYTSGTSGIPKGVWSGVLTEADGHRLAAEEADLWGFAPDDVHLVCSPLHHSAPVRFAGGTLLAGGTVLIPRRFDAAAVANTIERDRPTTTFMVPAHLQRLLALDENLSGNQRPPGDGLPSLSSLRLVAHAGAPCPEALKRHAIERFPSGSIWEFYGATEGQFTACSTGEWLARPNTVGRARPGRRLEVDESGVIWCHTPAHGRFEYWNDPEKTAAAWRGTAFTVGDLGRLDHEGYLFIEGRRSDLIITGGVNVYPLEVETALRAMPGLRDVAVFGAPDETWGQRVCAVVVGRISPAAVLAFARSVLASYKCPKQVIVVDEIPLGPTGKVRRAALASDFGLGS